MRKSHDSRSPFSLFSTPTNRTRGTALLNQTTKAGDQQQSLDAALFHLLPPHRQLLRPQHVCRRGGGELSQVPPAPGGGGGQEARGETPAADGKKEEK